MRIYLKRTQFIQDAEEYLRNDNSDYETGIDDSKNSLHYT